MHMHEEKTGYFRYIKPVRIPNWGGDYRIHACMSLLRNSKAAVHYSEGGSCCECRNSQAGSVSVSISSAHVDAGELILDQRDKVRAQRSPCVRLQRPPQLIGPGLPCLNQ